MRGYLRIAHAVYTAHQESAVTRSALHWKGVGFAVERRWHSIEKALAFHCKANAFSVRLRRS